MADRHITCPHCGHSATVLMQVTGETFTCPNTDCAETITIPGPAGAPPAPAAPPEPTAPPAVTAPPPLTAPAAATIAPEPPPTAAPTPPPAAPTPVAPPTPPAPPAPPAPAAGQTQGVPAIPPPVPPARPGTKPAATESHAAGVPPLRPVPPPPPPGPAPVPPPPGPPPVPPSFERHAPSSGTRIHGQVQETYSIVSLVLGIVSILGCACCGLNVACAGAAIAFGVMSRRALARDPDLTGDGMALAGIILGAVGLFLGGGMIILSIIDAFVS